MALDEYRKNFPLTDIEGAGETYHFIGAHSDVGGGYKPITKELIFEYTNKIRRQKPSKPYQIRIKMVFKLEKGGMQSIAR
ncbi:Uncharacterized conserved protein (DUF2235) [Rodentibacter pneumotropicus]|uniref:Uncharacterized conserved protein (DUF2235) n=1 Tax=Rodentibacter pneumotropicus TaxID=758 RepID=A0A448MIW3_9PAST|nr:Uncharacterized conserved protein (DUF2235) [Rodentibacter pneumotropicus]